MESYNIATIIFLSLFAFRIFFTCFWSHYRKNGCCVKKNSSYRDPSDEEITHRRGSEVFTINLNYESSDCRIDAQPPSYECLDEEVSPPDYDEAVQLPPLQNDALHPPQK